MCDKLPHVETLSSPDNYSFYLQDIAALGLTNTRVHPMDTGPQEASWAERCSPSSPTSRDEGEDQPVRVSPTSQAGHENGRGRVSPVSHGRNENSPGRVSPTGRGRNNNGPGRVSPTSRGGNEDDRGRVNPTGRGRNSDGSGTVTPTSRGLTGTKNGTANRKRSEDLSTVRNTSPRETTPESCPPVQADPLTCESIGSCDIIDMPNSDDHKKEVQSDPVADPGLPRLIEPTPGGEHQFFTWPFSPENYVKI